MAEQPAGEQKSEIEEKVRLLFRQGGYAAGAEMLKAHLGAHHEDVAAYELLADALRYSGDKPGSAAALSTASDMYAKRGMSIQSIAAQKRVIKLGVTPDFSSIRAILASAGASQRVPTPLFDDMSDEEFHETAERLEAHPFEPGDVVVEEGSPGAAMYVISSGTMEVVMGEGARQMKLADLAAGDFFGESALLSGRPRTATIRATSSGECLVLSREAFEEIASRHPRVRQVVEEFNRQRAASTIDALRKRQ